MARMTADQWAERIERWQHSGLKAAAFAAVEGCDVRQLSWWKWRLGGRDVGSRRRRRVARGAAIVPVVVTSTRTMPVRPIVEDASGSPIEIALPSGVRVSVARGFDRAALVDVLQALGALC